MKLIIVSNRLPISVEKQENELRFKQSAGGLVSGISDYLAMLNSSSFLNAEYLWLGSLGINVKTHQRQEVTEKLLNEYSCYPIFLPERVMDKFYHGFCNKTLWPLLHSFLSYVEYEEENWQIYNEVNLAFAKEILKIIQPDDIVWIHDYHLMLLPQMLRRKLPEAKIIFFLHIPFVNFEIFNFLPKRWREGILRGLLGADVVGFHTYEYSQNFLHCILRFLGFEHQMGKVVTDEGRAVKIGTYPIGINFQKFYEAKNNPQIVHKIKELKEKLKGYKVLLSIDRLDYTKGILNRLKSYETFLKENPQSHGKVVLIMTVVPSRVGVEQYKRTKRHIDEWVGTINGEFGTVSWTPILYQSRFLPFEELTALYGVANVNLVTPLRDGMNLMSKEYIATRDDQTGVLILSELAGAARELSETILVNPNDISEIALSIKEALEMPVKEQIRRNSLMQERIKRYDIVKWGDEMIKELFAIKEENNNLSVRSLTPILFTTLLNEYRKVNKRIIFLDYDGTFVPFHADPTMSKPDIELLNLIKELASDEKNKVVILSGRDKNTLMKWFGVMNIDLVAEHGVWFKEEAKTNWEMMRNVRDDWKVQIFPILKDYADRLPGSFIEEKDFSLVLHYRQVEPEQSSLVVKEALEYLITFTANLDIQVLPGDKIIEIKCGGVNKGQVALWWLSKDNFEFILALGDDLTDEDLFKILPKEAFTIKVGLSSSQAKFNLPSFREARELIKQLIER